MNISGIRPSAGIYDYNITRGKQAEDIAARQTVSEEKANTSRERETAPAIETGQTETAFDYAKKYEPDRTYEMKGPESTLEDLDMEQAISDMRKDQLLRQYQFFVGAGRRNEGDSSPADTLPYENFDI